MSAGWFWPTGRARNGAAMKVSRWPPFSHRSRVHWLPPTHSRVHHPPPAQSRPRDRPRARPETGESRAGAGPKPGRSRAEAGPKLAESPRKDGRETGERRARDGRETGERRASATRGGHPPPATVSFYSHAHGHSLISVGCESRLSELTCGVD